MIVRSVVLVLLPVTVLLFTLVPCWLAEYTEDIRKLQRDLETARKKNGIFVDEENYNQMQLELSTKSDEIRQTVAEIEVLKEQIEKVNELFCSTKIDLDKITKELELQKLETSEKAQELQERTKELTHTRKALDTISLQRDEQQHLVYHHVKNEKKLSAQGQKLKTTADRTTTDLKALHEKLERKRTIEKLNDEQSYRFRINLQQHLGEMEDSISQMWQQQSEYVNNMQSILGSGVELFHRQMTALSNIMSTLISSHSGLLGTLSSQLNHQGKAEQQWAGDTIKTVAQKKEIAISNHRTFLSEQFIPLMNVMHMLIQSQAATVQDHGKLLHSKLEQQESSIKFHLEEQKDALLQLKKNIQLFSSEQRNGLEVCQQHVARGIQLESELNKEWEEQINVIQKAISSVKQIVEKHHNQVTQEVPMIQKQLEDVSRSNQENKIKIDSNAKTLSSMLENFETSFIADTKDLTASSTENLSKVKETIDEIKEKHETVKSDILEFGHHSELTWEQNYQTMESIIRLHAETELQDLQDNQHCIQELATAMRAAAEQHDSLLELHKLEFEAQAAAQKSVISNMKDSSSIWSHEFSARIWQRDKEMENYLYEEMLKDQPTGQTPERKEYIYSKDLIKTTPDEKVLQRLRAIIYPSEKLVYSLPDSSFSEQDISSDFDEGTHEVKPEFTNEFSSGELSLTELHDETKNKEDKENVHTSVVTKHLNPSNSKTTSSPSPIKPLRANNIV